MSLPNDNVLVVIGSGPGIGRAVASLFASKAQSKIALISRNPEKLREDKAAIESFVGKSNRSVKIQTWAADIAEEAALTKVLTEVEHFGVPEVVFFNAARVVPSTQLVTPSSEIEYDFKITNIALHTTAKWAIPLLSKLAKRDAESRPSLLVTNSFLYKDPIAELFSLSLTKAAQRSLVLTLAKQFGHEGVHIGLVSVGGQVALENRKLNPEYIAEKTWEMYRQGPGEFSVDVEIAED